MKRPLSWPAFIGMMLIILSAALPLLASRLDPNAESQEEETAEATDAEVTEAANELGSSDDRATRVIPEAPEGGWDVYVVPIEGPITDPQLFILRRALKEAIANDVEIVLIDMDTPGGALNVTLEMMEALDKFNGQSMTFVNSEAMSAGSYISVATDHIWMAPKAIIGAAEAVAGGGQDIPESMQRKLDSYLRAKIRTFDKEDYRYRSDVLRAMMDPNFELVIDNKIIKREGELLSLTAAEAYALYGTPPQPLLADGIAEDIDDLLTQKLGAGNYQIKTFEVTWSENLAKWFQTISPVLLGLGILLLYFEAQTPTFGVLGMAGACMLLLVFTSNYFAGLAGHEEILFFVVGVILIGVEIFLIPGTLISGLLGALLVVGSLLWAMADIWPEGSDGFEISPKVFYEPVGQLAWGFLITFLGVIALLKFVPKRWFHGGIILSSNVGDEASVLESGGRSIDEEKGSALPEPGTRGQAITDLHPGGQIDIGGRLFQARLNIGSLDKGAQVEVIERRDFSLIVKAI
ncbi:MAG: hypothetical protein AAFX93_02685 [Verrucomicrobiota bacterium]